MQFFPRASDADITKAPLFFQILRKSPKGIDMREYPLLQAHHEDDGKFQTLGGMERHERQHVRPLIPGVKISNQLD